MIEIRSWSRSHFWWSWSDRDHFFKMWSMIGSRSLFLVIEDSDRQIIFRSLSKNSKSYVTVYLSCEITKKCSDNHKKLFEILWYYKNLKLIWKWSENDRKVIGKLSNSDRKMIGKWSENDLKWSVIWSRSLFVKVIDDRIEITILGSDRWSDRDHQKKWS